jgi:adenylate kinase
LALNVLLLGPQGSGKGTQAKRIAAEYGVPHIATGDILRTAIAEDGELGRRVKEIVERGDLVPDELMVEIIRDRLTRDDTASGFVLDGFPRTMRQSEALDAMLREIGRSLDVAFDLQVPEDVSFERLLRRAHEEGRTDDTPDVIRRRLELYRQETAPLAEYYRTKGILVGVHGDRSVNEVFTEIQQVLDRLEDAAA